MTPDIGKNVDGTDRCLLSIVLYNGRLTHDFEGDIIFLHFGIPSRRPIRWQLNAGCIYEHHGLISKGIGRCCSWRWRCEEIGCPTCLCTMRAKFFQKAVFVRETICCVFVTVAIDIAQGSSDDFIRAWTKDGTNGPTVWIDAATFIVSRKERERSVDSIVIKWCSMKLTRRSVDKSSSKHPVNKHNQRQHIDWTWHASSVVFHLCNLYTEPEESSSFSFCNSVYVSSQVPDGCLPHRSMVILYCHGS